MINIITVDEANGIWRTDRPVNSSVAYTLTSKVKELAIEQDWGSYFDIGYTLEIKIGKTANNGVGYWYWKLSNN